MLSVAASFIALIVKFAVCNIVDNVATSAISGKYVRFELSCAYFSLIFVVDTSVCVPFSLLKSSVM